MLSRPPSFEELLRKTARNLGWLILIIILCGITAEILSVFSRSLTPTSSHRLAAVSEYHPRHHYQPRHEEQPQQPAIVADVPSGAHGVVVENAGAVPIEIYFGTQLLDTLQPGNNHTVAYRSARGDMVLSIYPQGQNQEISRPFRFTGSTPTWRLWTTDGYTMGNVRVYQQ